MNQKVHEPGQNTGVGSLSLGEGNGNLLQYSCLEDPMNRGAWWAAVHGVTKSWTWLSDFTFTFHFHALEKEMATHSSVLAWRIPGTGEPGGLLCMGSHRVGHDWSDLVAAAAADQIEKAKAKWNSNCTEVYLRNGQGPWLECSVHRRINKKWGRKGTFGSDLRKSLLSA